MSRPAHADPTAFTPAAGQRLRLYEVRVYDGPHARHPRTTVHVAAADREDAFDVVRSMLGTYWGRLHLTPEDFQVPGRVRASRHVVPCAHLRADRGWYGFYWGFPDEGAAERDRRYH